MEHNEQSETEKIQNYEDAVAEGKHSMRRKQKERYVRKKRKKFRVFIFCFAGFGSVLFYKASSMVFSA